MATTSEDRPAGCWGLGVHAARDDAISFARRSGRRKRRSAPPSVARESPLGEGREPARMRAPRERVARREPTGVGLRWSASNVAGGEAGRGRIPTARCRTRSLSLTGGRPEAADELFEISRASNRDWIDRVCGWLRRALALNRRESFRRRHSYRPPVRTGQIPGLAPVASLASEDG